MRFKCGLGIDQRRAAAVRQLAIHDCGTVSAMSAQRRQWLVSVVAAVVIALIITAVVLARS